MKILRRIGDVLRPGVAWMLFWAVAGAVLSIVTGIVDPPSIDPGEGPVEVAKLLGGVGVASGVVFGLLLAVGERRRAAADMSLGRVALWGALAGAALPLLTSINDIVVASTGPLGAASAMLYVALARLVRRPASSVA